jgi:RNA polymerase sigma-70 factor (ECF subfamily)
MQLAIGEQIRSVPIPVPSQTGSFAGPGALERAFDAHHAMVFRAAYKVTGNVADAEDVLQTVFLRLAGRGVAADGTEDPDGIENIQAYLRRAAVNASINLLEQKSRANLPLDKAPEPSVSGHQADLREVLRLAMGRLGPRTAEMFAMRFVEGYSNGEIAEEFGVSSLVVAVTLHRARKQLQKELANLSSAQPSGLNRGVK